MSVVGGYLVHMSCTGSRCVHRIADWRCLIARPPTMAGTTAIDAGSLPTAEPSPRLELGHIHVYMWGSAEAIQATLLCISLFSCARLYCELSCRLVCAVVGRCVARGFQFSQIGADASKMQFPDILTCLVYWENTGQQCCITKKLIEGANSIHPLQLARSRRSTSGWRIN